MGPTISPYEVGKGVDGVLVRVANVDRLGVVGVHEGHQAVQQVRHVLKGPEQNKETKI